jgi:molybdopterin synthase sulfur carrier subunit
MKVMVRYFASIREVLGTGEAVEVESGTTIAALRDTLIRHGALHAGALARGKALRCALNQTLCEESTVVPEGAEVAFFPPVTGG